MPRFRVLLPAGFGLLLLACNSGTSPVAPEGTLFTISAHPSKIAPFGTSEIRVVALHESGVPIRTGTEVRFTATNGSIDPVAKTDRDGVARATFKSDGRGPTATVEASSGAQGLGESAAISTEITIEAAELVAMFGTTVSGLNVKFEDQSQGTPTEWEWTFGDGATSTDPNPLHTYKEAGNYVVSLRVSNPDATDTTTQNVAVRGALAAFSFTRNGLEVEFTDESSPDPIAWEWTFGDGGSSGQQNPTHTYAAAGSYRVRLNVITQDSGSDRAARTVDVVEAIARFSFTADGLRVFFTDESSPTPASWDWEFGDGGSSSQQNPVNDYGQAGSYRVTLRVETAEAGEAVTQRLIEVAEVPSASFTVKSQTGLTVIFEDASTGEPTSWRWSFGDGGSSREQDPAHTYAAAGTYTVSLRVRNAAGSDTETQFVTVP